MFPGKKYSVLRLKLTEMYIYIAHKKKYFTRIILRVPIKFKLNSPMTHQRSAACYWLGQLIFFKYSRIVLSHICSFIKKINNKKRSWSRQLTHKKFSILRQSNLAWQSSQSEAWLDNSRDSRTIFARPPLVDNQ